MTREERERERDRATREGPDTRDGRAERRETPEKGETRDLLCQVACLGGPERGSDIRETQRDRERERDVERDERQIERDERERDRERKKERE